MRKVIIFLVVSIITCSTFANNLQFGALSKLDATHLQFTIQWDNSWKVTGGPANYDAVWVFLKYQDCATNYLPWGHVPLSTTASDHTVTGGILQIDATADGKGVFIHRSAAGSGNITSATVTLKIGITDNNYNYQLDGIEMVNIPQGAFYIGDGSAAGGVYSFSAGPGLTAAKLIDSNIQNTAGLTVNDYLYTNTWGSSATLPTAFPFGYNAFYIMKYEISQEAYAAFLNTLTYDQQVTHFTNAPNSATGIFAIANLPNPQNCRNGIRIKTPGQVSNIPAVVGCDLNVNGIFDETDDGQNIACNWLGWSDLIAFLDWAALRPMTEFEYEKACRGTATPIQGEYPWGSTTILQATSLGLQYGGTPSEGSITSGSGLCAYGATPNTNRGPLRCGFEAGPTTNRAMAGSTFYGVMDMGGNVWEQCLGGYNFNYSLFTSISGDGDLNSSGLANTANWPPVGGGQAGGVLRGGNWFDASGNCATSYRNLMVSNINNINQPNQPRDSRIGGRGVRNP